VGVNLGNSGSWNRYAYVVGDPVNRNDPTGRDDCPEEEGGPEDPGGCYLNYAHNERPERWSRPADAVRG